LIVGGLYSITALRKIGAGETVYSKHRELKQASKQASATTKTQVASRHGSGWCLLFVLIRQGLRLVVVWCLLFVLILIWFLLFVFAADGSL